MRNDVVWSEVDEYFIEKLITLDSTFEHVLDANKEAGIPEIDVSPPQGKLLYLLTKMKAAKNVLEIGTLGGYSSLWFAHALPENGKVYTLEVEPEHAEIARQNIKRSGYEQQIEIIVGKALDTLPTLEAKGLKFDFIFIDADKENNPQYLNWALKLANPGALIIADNVVRNGEVIEENSDDKRVQGVRQFIDLLNKDPRIDSTAIQTVGQKGYDGFVMGIVR